MVNDLAQVNECNDDDENRPEKTLVDCKKDGEGNCGKEGEREGEWAGEHLKRIILKLMIVWCPPRHLQKHWRKCSLPSKPTLEV